MRKKEKAAVGLLMMVALILVNLPLGGYAQKGEMKAKPQGTLTCALPTLAEEGFLPTTGSQSMAPLWECVYDFLIYSDAETLTPKPGVAERWVYSKDYRSLTFYLRKGIQFREGWGEVTAEDVKFTIETLMGKGSQSDRAPDLRVKIQSVEVVNPYTVTIHLKMPDPVFWMTFCTADSVSLPVLCKKYIEKVGLETANRKPIGSGPYRLVEQKIGDYAKFEAYDDHWLVVPEFKYIVLRVVPETTTRMAMLQTREVDIAMELGVDTLPDIQKAGLRSVVAKNSSTLFFIFGGMLIPEDKRYVEGYHRKDPWADVKVREAMNLAVDREAIMKTAYHGHAISAPMAFSLPGWEQMKPIPYDPKRAKQLLAEAGYPNGFSFNFMIHAKGGDVNFVSHAAAGYWEAIGLKPKIVTGDYADWRVTLRSGKTAGWIGAYYLGNYMDWSNRLQQYGMAGAAQALWESPDIEAASNKARAEIDPKKREAAFNELAKIYRTQYPHIPIVYAPRIHAAGKNVGEWRVGRLLHPKNFIFARHAERLNTPRLFTP